MSIYFFQFFSSILPLWILTGLVSRKVKEIYSIFMALFLGFLFSYFAYFISNKFLQSANLAFNVNFIYLVALFFSILLYFYNNYIFKIVLIFLLSFCAFLNYFILSQDFALFSSSLLDTQGFVSLGFLFLGLGFCIYIFFFLRLFQNKILAFALLGFCVFVLLNQNLANIFLMLIKNNVLDSSFILSYVAKVVYFSSYSVYVFVSFLMLLALSLIKNIKKIQKNSFLDTAFRKSKALNQSIKKHILAMFIAFLSSLSIMLYFHLVASKPLEIDPPKEILPNENNEFIFDVALLRDNKLHRFAYVDNQGKIIRFFLLNKREDRDSPVAVFDACMICGDMGYVKKDKELICVSCNVRIFLLSVGKEGGCNPIPLKFSFDGSKVKIELKDVLAGANYFSQVKEIQVSDPVSKEKLLNTKAPFSYNYKGINYYFTNEKNYTEFKNDPEKYTNNQEAEFLIQRRNNVS